MVGKTRAPASTLCAGLVIFWCCYLGIDYCAFEIYQYTKISRIEYFCALSAILMVWPHVVFFTPIDFYLGKQYQCVIQHWVCKNATQQGNQIKISRVCYWRYWWSDHMLFWWGVDPPIHETNHHQGGKCKRKRQNAKREKCKVHVHVLCKACGDSLLLSMRPIIIRVGTLCAKPTVRWI